MTDKLTVTFSGPAASGKTTLMRYVMRSLQDAGFDDISVQMRAPNGSLLPRAALREGLSHDPEHTIKPCPVSLVEQQGSDGTEDSVKLTASAVPYSSIVGAGVQLIGEGGKVVSVLPIMPQGAFADAQIHKDASERIQQIVVDAINNR